MKQFIVLIAMVCLGIAIFAMIAGPEEDSIFSAAGHVWENQIDDGTTYP